MIKDEIDPNNIEDGRQIRPSISLTIHGDEISKFRFPKRSQLIWDLTLIWIQIVMPIFVFIISGSLLVIPFTVILVGAAQHGLSLVAHEGTHYLLSPSKKINDFVARWFFAAPALLPFSIYRKRHFQHHIYLSTEKDTKELYKRNIQGGLAFIELFKSLLGFDFLMQVRSVLKRMHSDNKVDASQNKPIPIYGVIYDFFSIILVQSIIFLCLLQFGIYTYLIFWLIPLVTISMLCGKVRSIVEHQPDEFIQQGNLTTKYFANSPTPILRSVKPNFLEGLLLWKINFSFHAEHHFYPFISYQYLPTIHDRLKENCDLAKCGYRYANSYAKMLWQLIFVKK